jgi:hypothetical protein
VSECRRWFAALCLSSLALLVPGGAQSQVAPSLLALKNGESQHLLPIYWVGRCKSIMIGLPEIEVLEGASEIKLEIRKEMVLPMRQNCAEKVPGGLLFITAQNVTERKDVKLTFRLKFKTKEGDYQRAFSHTVALFP